MEIMEKVLHRNSRPCLGADIKKFWNTRDANLEGRKTNLEYEAWKIFTWVNIVQ